ncbi:MAG: hypothetical protein A4E65_02380 [Syntrophorhabdus sp. PtaU1.Bin153]|nr:MAG: hypothetical protein A4E65_02380 [Syntrophorhabdus sp. PtaU1.Bin153]
MIDRTREAQERVGEEASFIEVLYAEERVASLNGTVSYNTGKEDHVVWYSEDRSRTCKNPRLAVIDTSTSIAFKLEGKITEYLTDTSYLEADATLRDKYCTITVGAPDLTPELLVALSGLAGSFFIHDWVVSWGGGHTIRMGSYLTAFFIFAALNILAATGNYQYEVWAQPTGRIKRTIQATADDLAHQAEMGFVVPKKLEDPLCQSVTDCRFVADWQMMTARLQRSRVTFEKIEDLRDEDGDTIRIPHPYTGQTLTVFITSLERSMQIGKDGYFLDRIEGWVLP